MCSLATVIAALLVCLSHCQRITHSGSDWYLRFRSERDLDRLETVRYSVLSSVDNDFVKTTVARDIFNPANVSQEYILEVRLPQTAFVSDIEIDNYKIEIVPKSDQHPGKHGDGGKHIDHVDHHGESHNQYQNFDLFRLPVSVRAWDNVTLSVTYHDLLQQDGEVRSLEIFLSPGEIVRQFSVQVDIARDEGEEQVVETLVMAPVLGDITNETVFNDDKLVNFTMNTREQAHYFGTNGAFGSVVIRIRTNQTEDLRRSAALNSAGRDTEDGFLLDYFLTALQGLEEDKPSSKVSQLLKLHLLMDQSRKTLEKIEELSIDNGWFTPLTNLKISSVKLNSSEVFSYSELISRKDELLSQ